MTHETPDFNCTNIRFFDDRSEAIRYEILADGTCSYCGREAKFIKLPDGDESQSNSCKSCDSFNEELPSERFYD
ncbi:hypothetical protein H6F78_00365 [Coleofasciculus sp. FACHB-64]|uniref:hypothetical protein n=1 Tax=Cyanophyceae TaxID=3028117 RepID=UPI0016849E9E|nr:MULTISPECIES: hypothetical protein [unclassified Coleofasciculus]MBD1903460.1 hypothetical protein [Coleofasciculus sp. FACHB-125]MBD1942547.1 hypothetical protein [Coleofasciculus sp. FACHB-712]MBD2044099.1 hypothetical protein [Coleofasciculus sp. FACHB-64]